MKYTMMAVYERKSTLWRNANGKYHAQNWTKMECMKADNTEDIKAIDEIGARWIDEDGNDRTEEQKEKLYYSKKFLIKLTNERGTNSQCFWFRTKDEANEFFKEMLHHNVFNGWSRVQ